MWNWDFVVRVGCVFVAGALQAQSELMIHATMQKHLAVYFTILTHSLLQFHRAQLHMRMTDQMLHQGSNDHRYIIPMDFQSLNMSCKMKLCMFFYIDFLLFGRLS